MSDSQSVSSEVECVCNDSIGGEGVDSITEQSPSHPGKPPFQASVEDCPEEDGVPIGTPRATPSEPVEMTSAPPAETQGDADVEGHANVQTQPSQANRQSYPSPAKENTMPAFIQLSGPSHDRSPPNRPEPLHYLDPESPVLTQEAIQRSVTEATPFSQPVATSPSVWSHSSASSGRHSDVFSQGGHRNNNSYDSSSWGSDFDDSISHVSRKQFDGHGQFNANASPYPPQARPSAPNEYAQQPVWPGSPHAQYSHLNTPYPTYAMADPMQGPPVPPPAQQQGLQRPPFAGYQHLAANLTGEISSYPKVTPIYRRFEALNHRLLLQLQDEIVEFEQQLDQLDEEDRLTRRRPHGMLPASRRAETAVGSNIGLEKQRLFAEIGSRLKHYYTLLKCFRATQCFSGPAQHEVAAYRDFFNREQIIDEAETRFLDRENDLISLVSIEYEESYRDTKAATSRKGDATPTPQSTSAYSSPEVKNVFVEHNPPLGRPIPRRRPPTDFAYAVLGAVAAPLLSFTVISGFVERMVIVAIVLAFVSALVLQSSLLAPGADRPGVMECVVCAAIYSVSMGVFAWSFS